MSLTESLTPNTKEGRLGVRKIFRRSNISYSLMCTRTCAYQGVRNVNFLEHFAYVLNE